MDPVAEYRTVIQYAVLFTKSVNEEDLSYLYETDLNKQVIKYGNARRHKHQAIYYASCAAWGMLHPQDVIDARLPLGTIYNAAIRAINESIKAGALDRLDRKTIVTAKLLFPEAFTGVSCTTAPSS